MSIDIMYNNLVNFIIAATTCIIVVTISVWFLIDSRYQKISEKLEELKNR